MTVRYLLIIHMDKVRNCFKIKIQIHLLEDLLEEGVQKIINKCDRNSLLEHLQFPSKALYKVL